MEQETISLDDMRKLVRTGARAMAYEYAQAAAKVGEAKLARALQVVIETIDEAS